MAGNYLFERAHEAFIKAYNSKQHERAFPYLTRKEAISILETTPGLYISSVPTTWDEVLDSMIRWGWVDSVRPIGFREDAIILTSEKKEKKHSQ